jgi:hypothetical protein
MPRRGPMNPGGSERLRFQNGPESPLPTNVGRRFVFVSSDHEDAGATVQARALLVFQNLIRNPM